MLKIKDMVLGETINTTLVISSSTIAKTNGGKYYLRTELFDGIDKINMMIWNYKNEPIPMNTILDIKAVVGDYLGTKQLNYISHELNTELPLSTFAPDVGVKVAYYLTKFADLYALIENDSVKYIVNQLLHDNLKLWTTVPAAKSVHHAFLAGTLMHSVDVATVAYAIAQQYDVNTDLVLAGALLHDIGKLLTYEIEGVSIVKTYDGEILGHIAIGMLILEKFKQDDESTEIVTLLQHIIASHHGQKDWGAVVTPRCMEAFIVHFADNIDATLQSIRELNTKASETSLFTDKIWTLGNEVMVKQTEIERIITK